ncbi:DUF4276 family protein [Stigmatella aurantiaca]|uniref:DUF4276 family protein n=1 Tax=Stigmatella aurantiaca TaxID=41 RepID=UPI003CCBDF0E
MIAAIVEGQGEEHSIPALVHRWISVRGLHGRLTLASRVVTAKGVGRLKAPYDPARHVGIEHYVEAAMRGRPDGLLVLLDADDECLKRSRGNGLAQELLERARSHARGCPVSVVVADREFEAWFLEYLDLLWEAGCFPDLSTRPEPILNAHERAGCKRAVGRTMGTAYNPAVHQRTLVAGLPVDTRIEGGPRSYRKLMKELSRLADALGVGGLA